MIGWAMAHLPTLLGWPCLHPTIYNIHITTKDQYIYCIYCSGTILCVLLVPAIVLALKLETQPVLMLSLP